MLKEFQNGRVGDGAWLSCRNTLDSCPPERNNVVDLDGVLETNGLKMRPFLFSIPLARSRASLDRTAEGGCPHKTKGSVGQECPTPASFDPTSFDPHEL
jgi:hypothetical protein